MKSSVYIESSVISYLTARPSRDVVKAARQTITMEWWKKHRPQYNVCISVIVRDEIALGHPDAAQKRLDKVSDLECLELTPEAQAIADALVMSGHVPENSYVDALHIGVAAAQGSHFLLTWNFKHINNAHTKGAINQVITDLGYEPPMLCSPEELEEQR